MHLTSDETRVVDLERAMALEGRNMSMTVPPTRAYLAMPSSIGIQRPRRYIHASRVPMLATLSPTQGERFETVVWVSVSDRKGRPFRFDWRFPFRWNPKCPLGGEGEEPRASTRSLENRHRTTDECEMAAHLEAHPMLWNLFRMEERSRRVQDRARKELQLCDVAEPHVLDLAVTTYNANGRTPPDDLDFSQMLAGSKNSDVHVVGFQEIVPLNPGNVLADSMGNYRGEDSGTPHTKRWEKLLENHLNRDRGDDADAYYNVCNRQMVGVYLTVWAKERLREHISDVYTTSVGVGVMGYMGNKGAVAGRMRIHHSPICFVCVHLSSGGGEVDHQRRNIDAAEVFRRLEFPGLTGALDSPMTVMGHHSVLFFGDLNYRVSLKEDVLLQLVEEKRWAELFHGDQLSMELQLGTVYTEKWQEGPIRFPPSYKFVRGTDTYVGTIKDTSTQRKVRFPAWCDRILWQGHNLQQKSYESSSLNISDHRPVTASFDWTTHWIDKEKVQATLDRIQRALDMEDMSRVPTCTLDPLEVDLGEVGYGSVCTVPLHLTNVGTVSAYFQLFTFHDTEGFDPYLPKWMVVSPPFGVLEPEEQCVISVKCTLRGGADGNAMLAYQGNGHLQKFLVLKIEGGRDFFITLQLKYTEVLSLGLDLECAKAIGSKSLSGGEVDVVGFMDAGYAQACEGLQIMLADAGSTTQHFKANELLLYCKQSIPSQVLSLLDYLASTGATTEGLFNTCLHDETLDERIITKPTVVSIISNLDQGEKLQPGINPQDVAEALVATFLALPYPFFPKVLADIFMDRPTPASALDIVAQVQEALSMTKWSTLCVLVLTLRTLLSPTLVVQNALSDGSLATVFSQALFGLETAAGNYRLASLVSLLLQDECWTPGDIGGS